MEWWKILLICIGAVVVGLMIFGPKNKSVNAWSAVPGSSDGGSRLKRRIRRVLVGV